METTKDITVECPLCGEVIEIVRYDAVSKSDVLVEHLHRDCIVNKGLPTPPRAGPPLPRGLRIKWPWRR